MSNSKRDFPSSGEIEDKAREKATQAKNVAKNVGNEVQEQLENDGVVNPSGLALFGFGGLFLAAIPLTSWITQPNSLLEKAVNGVIGTVGFVASAGSTTTVPQTGKIAALGALYVTVTYALTGAGSAAAKAAGNKEGLDNKHPRLQVANLRGLPLRLHSAHHHLMEMFPGWAISAALAQAVAPGDQSLINLLGLHVISKCLIHYPCYVFNVDAPRTLAHVLATSSIINVALRLSKRPLV